MNKKYTAKELDLLHAELYDILGETIRICRKHDIPYFVIGGTAIGALYDRAILPWDDDIDIGMARKDYNRFLEVAPRELGDSYFLSWIETDPHSPYYYAKVKKNNTLFVEEMSTADHVTVESIRHLQPVPFGPLTVNAPDNLEGFLRYNYPTLHRYTEEEQEKVNNHYPAALSFSTTPKQEL